MKLHHRLAATALGSALLLTAMTGPAFAAEADLALSPGSINHTGFDGAGCNDGNTSIISNDQIEGIVYTFSEFQTPSTTNGSTKCQVGMQINIPENTKYRTLKTYADVQTAFIDGDKTSIGQARYSVYMNGRLQAQSGWKSFSASGAAKDRRIPLNINISSLRAGTTDATVILEARIYGNKPDPDNGSLSYISIDAFDASLA